jgi:hypothetical protein
VSYVLETGFCEVRMETGLCELRTGDRDLCGTYWRHGFVRYILGTGYILETGFCELRTGDRVLRGTYGNRAL